MKNSTFSKAVSVLLAVLLVFGLAPVTAFADEATIQNDGDGDYVLMPVSGTDTLDLSGKPSGYSITVYDDGGPENDYSDDCDAYLLITAPSGYILRFGGGGVVEGGNFDYLKFFEGDTTDLIGNEKYGGKNPDFTVPEMYTEGNVLKIYFRSDGYYANYSFSGFALTVTVVDPNDIATVTYQFGEEEDVLSYANGETIELPTLASLFDMPDNILFIAWQLNGVQYAAGDSYTVNGDVTFTAITEAEDIVLSDGNGGWYSKVPKAGIAEADLSDRDVGFVLKVYDHAGPDGDYDNRCYGTLVITAPSGMILSFRGGGVTESQNYDYLTFFDENDAVIGNDKYGGSPSFTVSTACTTGNVLKIRFISDTSTVKSGFDLTVTVLDPDSIANVTYQFGEQTVNAMYSDGDTITLPTFSSMFTLPDYTRLIGWENDGSVYEEGEEFTLTGDVTFTAVLETVDVLEQDGEGGWYAVMPKSSTAYVDLSDRDEGFSITVYDDGGPDGDYSNGCNGNLVITAPEGMALQISGGGTTQDTSYDYLTFYEGNTTTVLEANKYGGDSFTLPALRTAGNELKIRFFSNSANVFEGFALTVTLINADTLIYNNETSLAGSAEDGYFIDLSADCAEYLDLSDKEAGFTFMVYDDGGAEGNYSSNCKGSLLVKAPEGMRFVVSGSGVSESASFDFLALYDGFCGDLLGRKFGGTYTVDEQITTGEYLKILFVSDTSGEKSGIALTVTLIDPDTSVTITYQFGEESAVRTVGEEETFTLLTFSSLFTLPDRTTFVGWQYNGTLYQPGDEFTANGDMTFTAVTEAEPVLLQDGEGNWYTKVPSSGTIEADLSENQAGFTFTVYDDGGAEGEYSNSCNGTLLITAPAGTIIMFGGSGSTEAGSSTIYDYLTFFDENDVTIGNARYGGTSFTVPETVTTGNVLKIRFVSDTITVKSGFALTVTIIDLADVTTVTYLFGEEEEAVTTGKGDTIVLPAFTSMFELPDFTEFVGWELDGTMYAAGCEYTVNASVTFTAVIEEVAILRQDAEGNWFANMSKSGTYEVDLSEKEAGFVFSLFDNGGADADYSDECNGTLVFTAPEGMLFVISGGGVTESKNFDYLTFYNADDTVIGADAYGGNPFTLPELSSAGNVLKVRFISDRYYEGYTGFAGFELTVTLVNAVDITYVYGEDEVVVPTEKGKDFLLPDFEELFTLPEGYAFASWYLLGSYYEAGHAICPNEPLTLTAVVAKEVPGLSIDFMGDYYLDMAAGETELDLSSAPDGFSFYLYDDGGANGDYSANCSSYLTITAPEGAKISVSGSGSTEEGCDFIKFFNDYANNDALGASDGYSGGFEIDELTTSGNTLTVFFSSDSENENEGFCVFVSIVSDTSVLGDVDGDSAIDIKDVTALLNVLAGGTAPGECDINGDGDVDIKDVTELLNILSGH